MVSLASRSAYRRSAVRHEFVLENFWAVVVAFFVVFYNPRGAKCCEMTDYYFFIDVLKSGRTMHSMAKLLRMSRHRYETTGCMLERIFFPTLMIVFELSRYVVFHQLLIEEQVCGREIGLGDLANVLAADG